MTLDESIEELERRKSMDHRTDAYELRVAWSEEDDSFVARVTEFPSLAAHGATEAEALEQIRFVLGAVIEELEAEGAAIPLPLGAREYSGRFNVRVPKSLHRDLVMEAERQGVSLNSLVMTKLAR